MYLSDIIPNTPSPQQRQMARHCNNPLVLEEVVVDGWRRRVDLKDGWAEEDSRVREGGLDVRLGHEDVGLATEAGWDRGGDVSALSELLTTSTTVIRCLFQHTLD